MGAVLCLQNSYGKEALLAPGKTVSPVPFNDDAFEGKVLFSTNVSWGNSVLSGTLTSSVIVDDDQNPFDDTFNGVLTFTYQLTINSFSTDAASQLTIGGFSDFLTEISDSFPKKSKEIVPTLASRSLESPGFGTNIRFSFLSNGGLAPGQTSALLIVQTCATTWNFSVASVIDSVAFGPITTLAPVNAVAAVPEPTSAGLGLLGLATLFGFNRLRTKN